MIGFSHLEEPEFSEFVEVDPTGRYGRYNEVLGKGASKTVYRAFDEYDGIEVAWNQVKLFDFLQSPEDLERLYCEIHLLKTLKHDNIMKFYTSWVDTSNRNINFVTEMFTSGTLRQYRLKHKRVNIKAVKHWCRQILKGLLYLHSLDPPVIHRDLKCDNIFVNGNQGEVKIGDLGLAAILRNSHAAHCVGTPEFMAPEVYEEEYNELVDVYSFGMCVLEMLTFDYPYSECTHPAQIYKKVISGKKPDALYKIKEQEVRRFVEKCLAKASSRCSARELLNDPFLQVDQCESDLRPLECIPDLNDVYPIIRQPSHDYNQYSFNGPLCNGYYSNDGIDHEPRNGWENQLLESELSGIDLFEYHNDEHTTNVDISIKGKRRDDDGIFLRLRIADKEGRIRNIYFPFDLETDTALSVAAEMVAELDITEQDVDQIADMIDTEVASLVPGWKLTLQGTDESPFANMNFCQNCVSNHTSFGSLVDYLSLNQGGGGSNNPQAIQCSTRGCAAATHGRFEEITYKIEEKSESNVNEAARAPNVSNNGVHTHCKEPWFNHESIDLTSLGSSLDQIDETDEEPRREDPAIQNDRPLNDDCGGETQQDLRWVKAKYQRELGKIKDQQVENEGIPGSCRKDKHTNGKSLYSGSFSLPFSLHRTTSLPVDAVEL